MAEPYEPEWECRRCHTWTRTVHRHCTWCGRYRFATHVTLVVILLVVGAAFVAVRG